MGLYKAPELRERRRGEFPLGTPLSEVYARAESFTVGVMMYGLLDCWSPGLDDVFHRAAGIGGAELPGCAWADEEMPPLPPDCPSWLSSVIQGLARSGATGGGARLSATQAIDMLGVDQVAMTMEQLEQSRAATADVKRQLEAEQQQLEELRRQAAESAVIQRREAAEKASAAEERMRQAGAAAEQMAEEARLREEAEARVSAEATAAVAEKEAEVRALRLRIASMEEGSMEERLRLAVEEREQAVQSARDWQAAAQARDKAAADNAGGAALAAGLLESVAAGGAQLLGAANDAIDRWQQQDGGAAPPPPIGEPATAGASEAAAELEEVSWAQFEIVNGRQHLLIAYRSGGVQIWDLDDDAQAGRDLRGGSGVSSEGGGGVAARLVLSRRRVGDPGEVVRCGVCLGAPDAGDDSGAVLLALSMTLPEGSGGLIRFLPVPGVGELPPLQTLAPVDSFLANANVLVAMMGGSQPVVRVWTRHTPDARHPNPAGVLTSSFEMAAEPTSSSSAPPVALGESWLAFAAPPPDEADSNGCPEALCVETEPTFVTTATSQAVEAADAAVGYLDGATRWLAGAAHSTLAPHLNALVAGEDAEPEPEPEPEPALPSPVVEPPTWDGDDPSAESGWVGVKHAVGKAWIAHFRAATTPVVAVQFSPSGRLLAVVANEGRDIELWKLQPHPGRAAGVDLPAPAVCIGHMSRGSRPSTVVDLCFSADERHLAVCSGGHGTVHVFALRPVVTGHAYRHTAHAKVHLPWSLDLGLGSWMGVGGAVAAEGTAAGMVTPLRATFAPPPLSQLGEYAARAARLLVLSPPGHLRLVALEPTVGGEESGVLSAVTLRDDGAAAVGRRRLDPDISTAPTTLATDLAGAASEAQRFASCARPAYAPRRTPLWSTPGVRTGPAGQTPESWEGLGAKEWVGGMLQEGDGELVLEGGEEGAGAGAGAGGGMMGVVNIDDHFEVPVPEP